ncbi:MAG TPA: hypothetical protein VHC22_11480 [Pirellulales bacterium]|nr:hypothetical protein [Pirellulales bacterium]
MTNPITPRPGGLTALCILVIVLGALGILTGLMGILGAVFQDKMQATVAQLQPAGDKQAARIQEQINQETRDFQAKHVIRNGILLAVRLLIAGCLLTGGIFSLRLHPFGRKTLLAAFAAGIVFEIVMVWPTVEAIPLTQRAMQLSMEAQQQGPNAADMKAMLRVMGKAITALQIALIAAMLLVKCGLYAFGLRYLTRPRIASLFVRQATADPQWA